jgi:phosphoribosyl-ATP pyrophosphohydrolase/phosphoribosyl-AMP cyclohydrolase
LTLKKTALFQPLSKTLKRKMCSC